MPWMIKKQGAKFCVYKKDAQGNPTGSSRGCHDSKSKAERQVRALYRNVPEPASSARAAAEIMTKLVAEASAQASTVAAMDTNGSNKFWYLVGPQVLTWTANSTNAVSFEVKVDEDPGDETDVRGSAFEGVLAVIGSPTSDGRYLIPDEVSNRNLPIPTMVQTATEQGHMGAEGAGRFDTIEYIPVSEFERREEFNLTDVSDDAVVVWATGTLDTSEHAADAERMIENGAGISIDMPPERIAAFDPETLEEIPEEDVDFQALLEGQYLIGIGGKIAAATIVSIPAFEEASIVLVPGHALVASAYGMKMKTEKVLTASAAGMAPLMPPEEWFYEEEPDVPVPLTVTAEGQVYGHLALWDQCHPAFSSCERAPRSRTDYAYFHVGEIETAEGSSVFVGRITVGKDGNAKGGHASVVLGRQGAMDHYDKTGCVGAFVRAKDGRHGIWLSGAVRSDAPAEKIRDMRANPPSGDWRNEELVAVLSVPVPGFPIPRIQALIASAENGDEEVQALIASGYTGQEYEPIDIPTYKRRLQELSERRAATLASK